MKCQVRNSTDVSPIFTQIGGARISVINATWPFATLQVTECELRLRCFGKRWTFPKAELIRLSEHRGFFSVGLRIQHRIERYTQFIVFWSFAFPTLKRVLEQRGYTVHKS